MATPRPHASSKARPIPSLRWWIGGLLFASTVINYIDRQTLSLLAPYLKLEYRWTNTDYANIAIAFRVASSIGGAVAPFIVLWIYFRWGWRPAFMIPGTLGFFWLIVWRWLYYPPEIHHRVSRAELEMIVEDKNESIASQQGTARPRWRDLL